MPKKGKVPIITQVEISTKANGGMISEKALAPMSQPADKNGKGNGRMISAMVLVFTLIKTETDTGMSSIMEFEKVEKNFDLIEFIFNCLLPSFHK